VTASEIKMKYNVLRLYISAFHPKALNVVDDLAGLLAYSLLGTFPLMWLQLASTVVWRFNR
jgi:hypothetical protein